MASTVLVTSSTSARPNTTDLFVIESEEVETLSIFVWCIGGILLISLLALLGRIVLARNHFSTQLEYLDRNACSNMFRVPIQQPFRSHDPGSPSRDTADLVPGSDMAVTDIPVSQNHRSQNGNQNRLSISSNTGPQISNNSRTILVHNTPRTNQVQATVCRPQILTADAFGRVATVNGYVIRPPAYDDVISTNTRMPSLIVSRPAPRFSL